MHPKRPVIFRRPGHISDTGAYLCTFPPDDEIDGADNDDREQNVKDQVHGKLLIK
jgi:hypothetical protein